MKPYKWTLGVEIIAFAAGVKTAASGQSRRRRPRYDSYNERAAFNDGWDTHTWHTQPWLKETLMDFPQLSSARTSQNQAVEDTATTQVVPQRRDWASTAHASYRRKS